ncbi:hypothetical protein CGRA01v4_04487 [Colletotrichum graminicola]|uniref:Celp0028 effector like protein n=1 Tax=Colletotrichum graminicola (strain M1.001 / M2 / FGSC 10212) TaxID=645133 RepID=E3Q8P4_COLGM|nr:uncharacterized protein GLRG_01903 [Colletotrichum graminicola M1.001]EFQ27408.1 hypothetical protein GLRG_01903 [Colletotrichum graminicola M1.001]WDK13206.1 hypothetical protein CGRA01v4_04487 [Colletotrichum graminicola]
MRFSILTTAGLLGVAVAAPAPSPVALNFDDVVVVGHDGTHQIMKSAEYDALQQSGSALAPAPPLKIRDVSRRDCAQSTEIQIMSDDEFLNWDVAISPVLSSNGGAATVSVSNGYSIANTVTVNAGITATIEKVIGLSLSVSYAQSWTTTETQTIGFSVPEGQFGVVVSQPSVRRVTGNVLSGCTDSPDKSSFVSDTYTSQSYGSLSWVKGVIRLCNSTTYPIPYCIGQGTHS